MSTIDMFRVNEVEAELARIAKERDVPRKASEGADKPMKLFISAPWYYTHTVLGIHNLVPILGGDVLARFYRMKGFEVEFVSGADEHGTRIELLARENNMTSKEITDAVFEITQDLLINWLQISTTKFCRTDSDSHHGFVQNFYKVLLEKGKIQHKSLPNLYCTTCNMVLFERFVQGTCPHCNSTILIGDECKQCGAPVQTVDLVNPICAICGNTPILRESKQWCIDLDSMKAWLIDQDITIKANKNVIRQLRNQSTFFSLFPITRDLEFGVNAPFPQAGGKVIYSWAESVLARLSCLNERRRQDVWKSNGVRKIFFMGKDNLPFLRYLLPGLLHLADENYSFPDVLVAHEFITFEGKPCSKSNGVGIWLDEAKKLVEDSDYWRLYLLRNFPQDEAFDFKLSAFAESSNDFFVSKLNTLLNLALGYVHKNGGVISTPDGISSEEIDILEKSQEAARHFSKALEDIEFQKALLHVFQYLEQIVKYSRFAQHPENNQCFMLLEILHRCAVMLYPFIPQSACHIIELLGPAENIGLPEKWKRLENGTLLSSKYVNHINPSLHFFPEIDIDSLSEQFKNIKREDFIRYKHLGELCENWNEGQLR